MALVRDYFKKTTQLKKEYGENSLVLMQVGAFYEAYGQHQDGKYIGSNIHDFSIKCGLSISEKKVCVGKNPVVMAGFRDYCLDKYLAKLRDLNYVVAVWSQDEKAAGTTRSLTGIYSPGTFFDSEPTTITNNTTCIWFQKVKQYLIVGISNIDIYTGKSYIFEYETQFNEDPTPYDELERFLSIFNPTEIIICHNMETARINDIVNYLDLHSKRLHCVDLSNNPDSNINVKRAINCEQQVYQKKIIEKYFSNEIFVNSNNDFLQFQLATQSYCYLLEFIYRHNPNLVSKIQKPLFENCSEKMVLANHSLKQLNMIDDRKQNGKLSSVSNLLNKCVTPMGKRKFRYNILNPTTDIQYLNREYSICSDIINNSDIADVRSRLSSLSDIEKLYRKLIIKKITPQELYFLVTNLTSIQELYTIISGDPVLKEYYLLHITETITEDSETIKKTLLETLDLEKSKEITSLQFEDNFLKKGWNIEHDVLVEAKMDSYEKLECIRKHLNDIVGKYENKKKPTEYVKIYHTEKHGFSLVATQRRTTILKQKLLGQQKNTLNYKSLFDDSMKDMELDISSIEYKKPSTGSNYQVISSQINKICSDIVYSNNAMLNSLTILYDSFITKLTEYDFQISNIVKFVSLTDFIFCKAHISKKYNYCRPEIEEKDKSFFKETGLRHPLIEQLLQDELYVPNDVTLDSQNIGILLYGTNAVGKSSFIKSIGISIILAQAGFFVPATSFTFFPYKHLFTRILGNDNLFKGLSTFAVEMLELKTILMLADEYSLILGDELCSGTEQDSAISIFLTGIEHLYSRSCNFIFATHFHEIVDYEEITEKPYLKLKHMAVIYDREKDCLLYDRKLREGPGESMYGLEVCKSLHLPEEFLRSAHRLRNKYKQINYNVLDWKKSHFNSKQLQGLCEVCKKNMSSEVHHLQHQQNADSEGYIGSFHKNHKANLVAVCEDCHLKFHKEGSEHQRKKTSAGASLENL